MKKKPELKKPDPVVAKLGHKFAEDTEPEMKVVSVRVGRDVADMLASLEAAVEADGSRSRRRSIAVRRAIVEAYGRLPEAQKKGKGQ